MRRARPSVPQRRLDAQRISHHPVAAPAALVAWLGAVQAQDYLASLWAVGLRLPAATADTIERAIADGSIVRTHVFRGTWQLVAPADLRWMLALIGPRVIAASASRYRELGLDAATLARGNALLAGALAGGHQLTRAEIAGVLTRGGIEPAGTRMLHLLGHAELGGVICSGGRRGKQGTFALLDERVAKAAALDRGAALAQLARRYYRSRGPATLRDFVWWSGLTGADARRGIEGAGAALASGVVAGETCWFAADGAVDAVDAGAHLLPAFDEYLVGYTSRRAVLAPSHTHRVNSGGGLLGPCVVVGGQVVGTWKRTLERAAVAIELDPFRPLTRRDQAAIAAAAARYAEFLGLAPRVTLARRRRRG